MRRAPWIYVDPSLLSPQKDFTEADAPPALAKTAPRRRAALAAGILVAALAGSFAGGLGKSPEMELQLVMLIRFMVLIKGAMAIGAAALVGWRLGSASVGNRLALANAAGVLTMAAAAPLMWHIQHLMLASAIFYAGAALIIGTGIADDRAHRAKSAAKISAAN